MTHQAIARKWRPQVFSDIAGQRHVTRTLQNAIRLGRIHHAFLLTGARGVGKTSAARILARALNCERGPASDPCNECAACREALAGTFPDLLEIDAASHNSVDDVRDLVDKARYTPQRGRYKIYVIDEVHMVSKAGFNALLKTLEEPPAHVIFILATTDPQALPDTVTSRCQRFDFKMIPVRAIYERLRQVTEAEGVSVPEVSLLSIAREGAGSMRDAQSLLDQVVSFAGDAVTEDEVAEILGFIDRSILYDVLAAALEGDAAAGLSGLARVASFGCDVRTFAGQLLEAVRNVVLVAQVPDAARLLDLPDGEIERLRQLAQGRSVQRLTRQFDVLAGAVDATARSEQPMLLLEMAVVKMTAVRDFVPVQSLVDRLEALERRLRKSGAAVATARRGTTEEDFGPPPLPPVPSQGPRPAAPPPAGPPPRDEVPRRRPEAPPVAAPAESSDPVLGRLMGYKRGAQAAPRPAPPAQAAPPPGPVTPPVARRDEPAAAARVPPAAPEAGPTAAHPAPPPREPQPPASPPRAAPPERGPSTLDLDLRRQDPAGTDVCDGTRWRRFAQRVGGRKGMAVLAAALSSTGFLGVDGTTILVGVGSEAGLRQVAGMAGPELEAEVLDAFGPGVVLRFVVDVQGRRGPSLAEKTEVIKQDRLRALEEASKQDASVRRTLDLFPGSVIEKVVLPDHVEIDDVE